MISDRIYRSSDEEGIMSLGILTRSTGTLVAIGKFTTNLDEGEVVSE